MRDTGQLAEVPQVSPCQYRFGVFLDNGHSSSAFGNSPNASGYPLYHHNDAAITVLLYWRAQTEEPIAYSNKSETQTERARTLFDIVRRASESARAYRTSLSRRLRDGVSLSLSGVSHARVMCIVATIHPLPYCADQRTRSLSLVKVTSDTYRRTKTHQGCTGSPSRSPDESNVFFSSPISQIFSCKCASHHRRKLIRSTGEHRASKAGDSLCVFRFKSWMSRI